MSSHAEKTSFRSAADHTHKQEESADPKMVVALGPGKFYGSSLPRPRFYTEVKLNEERVDPPVPVLDPLMSWAEEAHWSMGGLSFQRHRLQGRIEGNVKKLRAEREKILKKIQKQQSEQGSISTNRRTGQNDNDVGKSLITPPAPVAVKRRRRLVKLVDEKSSEEEEEEEREVKRTARKLGDDFDRVANDKMGNPVEGFSGVAARTRSQRIEEEEIEGAKQNKIKFRGKKLKGKNNGVAEDVIAAKGTRSSPRLVKRG